MPTPLLDLSRLTPDQVYASLGSRPDGLSAAELARRQKEFAANRVEGIDRNSMIDKCRKASGEAMARFEGDSFDAPSRAKFTAEQDKAIRAAVAAAFAKK